MCRVTGPAAPAEPTDGLHVAELRKEAFTMALYVAICLLAALIAIPDSTIEPHVYRVIWGVTLGLAVAHWFAFRLSALMVGKGRVSSSDSAIAGSQLAGAAAVALVSTIPAVIFDDADELVAVEVVLCAVITVIGFIVAHEGGANRIRAILFAAIVLIIAIAIAVAKNALAGALAR